MKGLHWKLGGWLRNFLYDDYQEGFYCIKYRYGWQGFHNNFHSDFNLKGTGSKSSKARSVSLCSSVQLLATITSVSMMGPVLGGEWPLGTHLSQIYKNEKRKSDN